MHRYVRNGAARLLAVGWLAVLPLAGFAQTYPSQPVTLVVSSAAGGIVDTVARLMAPELTSILKVPVVVEVVLERVTNISMGVEIDNVVEFEELALTSADAPTAIISMLD